MATAIQYRAGPGAARVLRDRGLTADTIAAIVGPASGPKWIALAGLDRALLESGLLGPRTGSRRPLLVGASAGGWRMLSLAAGDPRRSHRMLLDGYVSMRFRGDRITPEQISTAYRSLLAAIFPPDEIAALADHPDLDLALHVVRSRIPLGGPPLSKPMQLFGLAVAGLLQTISTRGTDAVFERVLFHTRPDSFGNGFAGRLVRLTADNLLAAAVATGTVPIYMQPRRDLPGAPRGRYLDGGLSDYHLRQRYTTDEHGITLFPHFQRRIVPAWFDRTRARRTPAIEATDSVLQIHPTDEFVASLPDGRLPDREDFHRYAANPDDRIERWNRAASIGERLGEQFLDDLRSGRIPDLIEPI